MDDPGHQAENRAGNEQPAAPEQRGRPEPVRPGPAPGYPYQQDDRDQRGRQQPADLPAQIRSEQPGQAGLAAERRAAPAAAAAAEADRAGLIAVQPAQAVVAERQLNDAVRGGPADIRPARRRGQLDDRDPPAGRGNHGSRAGQQLPGPPNEPARASHQVSHGQGRQDQERLQHLGQEPDADQRPGQHEPAGPPRIDRPGDRVCGQRHQQHEQRVRVVEPEHQRGHRGAGQRGPGQQPGGRSGPAPHRRVEHADGGHAFQCLRHQQAPVVQPEDAGGQFHHPQRGRRLVDGNETGGVERAEEECLPAGAARLHGGRVEVVGPAAAIQADQVQAGGAAEQREKQRPRPGGLPGGAAHQPARAAGRPTGPRPARPRPARQFAAGSEVVLRIDSGGGHPWCPFGSLRNTQFR